LLDVAIQAHGHPGDDDTSNPAPGTLNPAKTTGRNIVKPIGKAQPEINLVSKEPHQSEA